MSSKHGLVTVALCLCASVAQAHISLEQGGTHKSRYGDGELKAGPCGRAGGTRGTNIYTYKPGETISLTIVEFVPHPSYFRVAFDQDGDDGFLDPRSIMPIDPARGCPAAGVDATADKCDASDFYNSPEVLPDMDNLNPHGFALPGAKYTFMVKLPNVECQNCTLQVIQVMEDPLGHGAFDGVSDIYHQCIDLVLKSDGATGTGGTTPTGTGGSMPSGTGGSMTGGVGGTAIGTGGSTPVTTGTGGMGGFAGGGAVGGMTGTVPGTAGEPSTPTPTSKPDSGGCTVRRGGSRDGLGALGLSALALCMRRRRLRTTRLTHP